MRPPWADASTFNTTGFGLARYMLSGNLDTTFGSGGIVTNPDFARFTSLVVQPNGQIVAVGDGDSSVRRNSRPAWRLPQNARGAHLPN